jgi:hypothetical protein
MKQILLGLYVAGFMGVWTASMEYAEQKAPDKSWLAKCFASTMMAALWPPLIAGSATYRFAKYEYEH